MTNLLVTPFKINVGSAGEFLMLPFGHVQILDGHSFQFSADDAARVVSAFKQSGRELLIDLEHQSISHLPAFECFKAPNGKAPAAGWVRDLEVRADGLYATQVQWVNEAAAAIRDGAYRYFSPVLTWLEDKFFGRVASVQSIALTNDPRIKGLTALAAKSSAIGVTAAVPGLSQNDAAMPSNAGRFEVHAAAQAWLAVNPGRSYVDAVAAVSRFQGTSAFKAGTAFKPQFEPEADLVSLLNPTGHGLANFDLHSRAVAWLRLNPSKSYVEAVETCNRA